VGKVVLARTSTFDWRLGHAGLLRVKDIGNVCNMEGWVRSSGKVRRVG